MTCSDDRVDVGILFGGPSGEHEVSLMSAAAVWDAIDRDQFSPHAIPITRGGDWYYVKDPRPLFAEGIPDVVMDGRRIRLIPGKSGGLLLGDRLEPLHLDVIFPVLHGPFGEDGAVQGLLEILSIPYVGAGVAASGAAMDKLLMKRLFRASGLPIPDFLSVPSRDIIGREETISDHVSETFGFPCFVKPAALGSSLGVVKVTEREQLGPALRLAGGMDRKVIIEAAVVEVRELECSVLGNSELRVAGPGEVIPGGEFYDYQSKYWDDRTQLVIPASVPKEVAERSRQLACSAFRAVDASGLARVDLFYQEPTNRLLINEINTIPGFTKRSMYPRLWSADGMTFSELINELLNLARARFSKGDRAEEGSIGVTSEEAPGSVEEIGGTNG